MLSLLLLTEFFNEGIIWVFCEIIEYFFWWLCNKIYLFFFWTHFYIYIFFVWWGFFLQDWIVDLYYATPGERDIILAQFMVCVLFFGHLHYLISFLWSFVTDKDKDTIYTWRSLFCTVAYYIFIICGVWFYVHLFGLWPFHISSFSFLKKIYLFFKNLW